MRDRLIELLQQADAICESRKPCKGCAGFGKGVDYHHTANHLLANGVIVLPCKIGDTVYTVERKAISGHWEDNRYIVDGWGEWKVCEIPFSLTLWEHRWDDVYLTREEAEKALAERREQ